MLNFPSQKKFLEKNIKIFIMSKNKIYFFYPVIQLGYVNQVKGTMLYIYINR